MELPDEVLLNKVQTKNVHFDRKSIEEYTGREGRKYKLAGNIIKILGIYIFFILTTRESACKRRFTFRIYKKDWENKSLRYLNGKCSYLDLTKNEVIEEEQLLNKIKNRKNRFTCVAKLCERKYKELQVLCKKTQKIPSISKEAKDTIGLGLLEITEERLRSLGL